MASIRNLREIKFCFLRPRQQPPAVGHFTQRPRKGFMSQQMLAARNSVTAKVPRKQNQSAGFGHNALTLPNFYSGNHQNRQAARRNSKVKQRASEPRHTPRDWGTQAGSRNQALRTVPGDMKTRRRGPRRSAVRAPCARGRTQSRPRQPSLGGREGDPSSLLRGPSPPPPSP